MSGEESGSAVASGLKKHPPRDMHQGVPTPPYAAPAPVGDTDNVQNEPSGVVDADMIEDHISFLRTVAAFRNYHNQAMSALQMRKRNFEKLQEQHRDLLCIDLESMLKVYQDCIEKNAHFFEAICEASEELFENYWPTGTTVRIQDVPPPTPLDMDKVFSTLRQFVRDWSAEGAPERDCVYKPILDTLESIFPNRSERTRVRVLAPGAGLCRLSVELALRGFFAQANEFSYHMLIAGHYIQNHVYESSQHTIFPYCDNTSNLVNRADQFAEVYIPDLCASEAIDELHAKGLNFGELSMVAGDFTEVYSKPSQHQTWSAVATCFFIDTAHNIVEYLEIIFNLLKPGGVWVNIGPLLYHFADVSDDMSIELSLGELLTVAQRIGFELTSAPPSFVDTTYTNNQRSMKQLVYRCAFFVLRRPLGAKK